MAKKAARPLRVVEEEWSIKDPYGFVMIAIDRLRQDPDDPNEKGIHTVYSGFNAAFRLQFPGMDPIKFTQMLRLQGKIAILPIKGGMKLYYRNSVKESVLKVHDECWVQDADKKWLYERSRSKKGSSAEAALQKMAVAKS